jgi:hypothetical protein
MPHEVTLDLLPAGITVSAGREGETVSVQYRGVATTEDGEQLVRYLGFADEFLAKIATSGVRVLPSLVDNLAVIIRRNRTATVYVNELNLVSSVRVSCAIRAGQAVRKDDIVDFGECRFDGIDIPADSGVILLCSAGWRRGVLFDFGPLDTRSDNQRDYNIWEEFGGIITRLHFQERFAITNDDWSALFAKRWFPFAGLCGKSIDNLLGHVRAGWGVESLVPAYRIELQNKISGFLESWKTHDAYEDHVQILERAVERFRAEDYVSCTSILYPRIEGILRSHHLRASLPGDRKQQTLAECAVESKVGNPYSLLLPQRFHEYLRTCFFASFDEEAGTIPLSRNSVGHGVASESEFNLESAIIALLVCHQLFYCVPNAPTKS